MTVYVLHHVYKNVDGEDEVKLIGVYSTEQLANEAASQLRDQPGFRDTPNGFQVNGHQLDRTNWNEGFFTYSYRDDASD